MLRDDNDPCGRSATCTSILPKTEDRFYVAFLVLLHLLLVKLNRDSECEISKIPADEMKKKYVHCTVIFNQALWQR